MSTMPRAGSAAVSDLRQDRLEVTCAKCGRRRSYSVERLWRKRGTRFLSADAVLTGGLSGARVMTNDNLPAADRLGLSAENVTAAIRCYRDHGAQAREVPTRIHERCEGAVDRLIRDRRPPSPYDESMLQHAVLDLARHYARVGN